VTRCTFGKISSLSLVLAQALENAKATDLLFWASRYNLFVLWSADRTHPWDSLPGAANHATLEIGKQRGSENEVRCLFFRRLFLISADHGRLLIPPVYSLPSSRSSCTAH
jgi:hypothetical protein